MASEFSPERIFISYSRSDGREFAEALEQRLEADAGIRSWRDLKSMESGDIRPQVLRAIERVQHLVLVLSRRALTSDWIKREWSHARTVGKRVSPVLADPALTRADLPPWMRREEVFDIDPERDRGGERWKALVLVLRGDGRTKRAPYMPGDLPADFVPRPAEYEALKAAVLAEAPEKTVALTTALQGAGGYGKTTLANYLCRDPDVRFEFSDGIVRAEVGKERGDVTGLVSDLIEKLDPEGKRPGFTDVVTASEHLGELIGEARLLLVIDDVWREAQLRPFLRGGPNCVRLVTTRLPRVLPASHAAVNIDEMQAKEAERLLASGLPIETDPAARLRLSALADRLGNWAQLLAIANGWLRARVERRERLADAVARFERRLEKDGPFVFDPKDETQRHRAISLCIAASVEDLDAAEAARFSEMAVLPEDEDVPLGAIEALWAETGGADEDEADDLVRRLDALSLLQSLDLGARTLRLHDNMLWYLRDRTGPEGLRAAHAAMVRATGKTCQGGGWAALPAGHAYGWRFLVRHLRGAGRDAEADRLLTDYAWIRAKLRAVGPRELFAGYLPEPADEEARLVGRAVALSLPALAADPRELPRQLYGRLGGVAHPAAASLAAAAREDPDFRPAPRWPGLTPPGAERLRLVGHENSVVSAAFSPDGARVVTASLDRTARVWDAETGAELAALRGHGSWVWSAAFSPGGGGRRVVTTSGDRTARLWDAATGAELAALCGHEVPVTSAAFSPDGARVVTASGDRTARVWDAETGAELAALRGHEGEVSSAAFSPNGARVVTVSADRTARVWDAETEAELAALRGHEGEVSSAAFSPDGARVVTVSADHTARVWDAETGAELAALRGHEGEVSSAAFSPNGARVLTASNDGTARLWDAATGAELAALRGHEGEVSSAAVSPDGARVLTVSGDHTVRLWDAATGAELAALRGHEGSVRSAAFSPDGARVLTASEDRTARLWDAATGAELAALRGHEGWVKSAAFSPDGGGRRVLTASWDRTARLWDAATGAELAALRGHEDWVESAAFSPNGARVVTASGDGTARVWDAATGKELATLRGHEVRVSSAAFSPDGVRVVTASGDRTARVWDAATGKELAALRGHEGWVESAAFSPDGARVVTASGDGTARVWDAATGKELATLRGHEDPVSSAAFSPDGARVLTASRDHTARLWDAATGVELAALRGHEGEVRSATFSPDGGRRVVTASGDRTARVWDAATGKELATLRGHEVPVSSAAFSPDGVRVVTASGDRTARVWDAATGKELAQVALDAMVTALAVRDGCIALGDALGRVHVFDAKEFLGGKAAGP